MEYRIQQKATIWYETSVEANSPEEAVEITQDPERNQNLDWWQVDDSTSFLDTFWWSDEDENEGEIGQE